jgi:hypothetical protein
VRPHGDHARQAQLVIGERAVDDRTGTQEHRHPGLGPTLREAEEPGRHDQERADDVVDVAVDPGRDEAHRWPPPRVGPAPSRGREQPASGRAVLATGPGGG